MALTLGSKKKGLIVIINANDVLKIKRLDVWLIPDEMHEVSFADGVVVHLRTRQLIFNRYIWGLFELHPDVPILSTHDVSTYLGKNSFDGSTHIRMLESIFQYICVVKNLQYYSQKEHLLKKGYRIVNDIFNEIILNAAEDVTTIDAIDYVKLINDPRIVNIHSKLNNTPESIDRAYKEIRQYVNDDVTNNRFIAAYKSKAINDNQANQCIGPRGLVTDLDRTVFKQPIHNGFIRGMGNLYELIAEERTAAKALNATDIHIKTSEYASRRIQVLTMCVTGIEALDCGSTDYAEVYVKEKYLPNLKGKYYLDETTNKLSIITGSETHLINTVIKMRTSLGCKAHDRSKICATCLGGISRNFKENSNLGYTMTAYLMEKLTQAILSTKHLTHSVKKSSITLNPSSAKYFRVDAENNIYFNPDVPLDQIHLVLPNAKLNKLVDVLNLKHTNVAMSKIGELEIVGIRDARSKSTTLESVNVAYKDRMSNITRELLIYIKSVKVSTDPRGNFVVPMGQFDISQPVFHNPLKETNVVTFVNRIAAMIETNADKITDPIEKLFALFDAVLDQFNCNISVLEVMVYATTAYDAKSGDYRLGRGSPVATVETKANLFRNRSMAALLIYEHQHTEILKNPTVIFSNMFRSNHPADVLFQPQSVV